MRVLTAAAIAVASAGAANAAHFVTYSGEGSGSGVFNNPFAFPQRIPSDFAITFNLTVDLDPAPGLFAPPGVTPTLYFSDGHQNQVPFGPTMFSATFDGPKFSASAVHPDPKTNYYWTVSDLSFWARGMFDVQGTVFNVTMRESSATEPGLSMGFRAVPEPSSWAMMLIGFGAVGGATRVRRRVGKLV